MLPDSNAWSSVVTRLTKPAGSPMDDAFEAFEAWAAGCGDELTALVETATERALRGRSAPLLATMCFDLEHSSLACPTRSFDLTISAFDAVSRGDALSPVVTNGPALSSLIRALARLGELDFGQWLVRCCALRAY